MAKTPTYEVGQKVETIHGEKLEILAVDVILLKKEGKPTGKTQTRILAKSGDADCWFPVAKLKGAAETDEE